MMSVMEVALEGSTTNRVHKELSSAYEDGDEGHAALGVVYVIKPAWVCMEKRCRPIESAVC
jgi:hypothetical protein